VTVAAVIPAYNEAATIGEVIRQTRQHVTEVVVVDDGSTDGTPEIARSNGAVVLEHTINIGVGGAQRTGYRYVLNRDFEFIVQVDGDGQHDPDYIPELLSVAEECDMVIGSRYLNESIEDYPFVRRLGISFFTTVVNQLGGIGISDVTSGFRVYRTEILAEIIHSSDNHWAVEQTLAAARKGFDIREVSVKMPTRDEGESQFDLDTLVLYPVRMMDIIFRILVFR
jgi:glycosyltransferase involved in cell wall biosynthesis